MKDRVSNILPGSLLATDSPGYNAQVQSLIRLALAEDIGRGDITTEATVPTEAQGRATIRQKAPGVVCGLPIVAAVFAMLDTRVSVVPAVEEGHELTGAASMVVAYIDGPARAILTGERTALNFLQRLSGVATMSRRAAQAVEGTGATVLDTRKTTPGHRVLEKYAVRVGGCHNHRAGLDDAVLLKENHIKAAGGIGVAVAAARTRIGPAQIVEVEVTNPAELDEALAAGAELVLLDNHTIEQLRAAVAQTAGRARLEASGGITVSNLNEVALTGVNYISLGALTHSAPALDFSLEVT
ncbi:MAG: carboxylating nicotinate-nucleotide diphosphorylase [Chloroflexota bacterium]|nr:carboxylating nicotinate-nucleotide diphosphorylase [Chloroflexota bacterium]